MANIVFLTLDGGGNVPPALEIAGELRRRGHRVRFLGAAAQESAIRAAGFDVRAYEIPVPWTPAERVSLPAESRAMARLIGGRGYAEDLAAELHREAADAVVIDCLIPGSIRAALQFGVPVIVLMHSLAEFWRANPLFTGIARLRGFSVAKVWASADAVLVTADAALDRGTAGAPGNYVWTGVAEAPPSATPVPAEPPRVLISLSSIGAPGQQQVLQRILDAVAPLPIEAIVTTGRAIDPAELRAAANTTVHRHLPHLEVLRGCSAVVGHGGHSTAMRALTHGLPTVLVPCDTRIDQPMVAKAVADTGAGIALPKKAKPEEIRAALTAVLNEPAYRSAAAAVGERLRAANGSEAAADHILRLAADGARAGRSATPRRSRTTA